jgi:hypothetical protein
LTLVNNKHAGLDLCVVDSLKSQMWNRISASARLAILKEAEDHSWALVGPIETRIKLNAAMTMWESNTMQRPFKLWVVYSRKTKRIRLLLEKMNRRKRKNTILDWNKWAVAKKESRFKTVNLLHLLRDKTSCILKFTHNQMVAVKRGEKLRRLIVFERWRRLVAATKIERKALAAQRFHLLCTAQPKHHIERFLC